MKTLVAYATKYGCTERCAEILSEKLEEKADLCNLKKLKVPDLGQYDKVIVGGSVYAGKIRSETSQFCKKNLEVLKSKKIGLFICGMGEEEAAKQINAAFPRELLNIAVAKGFFGGELVFNRMNSLERFIIKKIAKTDKDISKVLDENIDEFARQLNEV
jgi:menaquinone-dependent protoporphyrinogen oxidase